MDTRVFLKYNYMQDNITSTTCFNNDYQLFATIKWHLHLSLANKKAVSLLTAGCRDVQEIPLLIPPLAYTADKCLEGLIQREFKIRLLIFITWLQTAGDRQSETDKPHQKWERTTSSKRTNQSWWISPRSLAITVNEVKDLQGCCKLWEIV